FRTTAAHVVAQPAAAGGADLHERWEVEGPVATLAGTILHDSYPTLASYLEKFSRYTAIEAAALRPSFGATARELARAPLRAAWLFFGRGGFRDGLRGAAIALGSALYPLVAQVRALLRR
ncbi:MAG: hypothetical protein ACREM2_02345, partial [Vulcanimicrobiaceae bacterium]